VILKQRYVRSGKKKKTNNGGTVDFAPVIYYQFKLFPSLANSYQNDIQYTNSLHINIRYDDGSTNLFKKESRVILFPEY
jgi:hypothetical protein